MYATSGNCVKYSRVITQLNYSLSSQKFDCGKEHVDLHGWDTFCLVLKQNWSFTILLVNWIPLYSNANSNAIAYWITEKCACQRKVKNSHYTGCLDKNVLVYFYYNSCVSWLIFKIIFVPLGTGINTLQSRVIYLKGASQNAEHENAAP